MVLSTEDVIEPFTRRLISELLMVNCLLRRPANLSLVPLSFMSYSSAMLDTDTERPQDIIISRIVRMGASRYNSIVFPSLVQTRL
ncbi:hypothetical protein KI372_01780, partial [Halobacterium salinarum]|nr:hypothetical protein [Halobacterium salinarum]